MTKIKPVKAYGKITSQDVTLAIRCIVIGAMVFMVWEILQGRTA